MKQLLLIPLLLVMVGCGGAPQSPDGAGGSGSPAASAVSKPIKQLITCSSSGTDGQGVAYKIQYTLKKFTDDTQEASCSVTQGHVMSLKCPSDQPMYINYALTEVYSHAGQPTPYTKYFTEGFNVTASNCAVANL